MIKVNQKDFEDWIKEIRLIHSNVNNLFQFGKGFFGNHPKLIWIENSLEKLDKLATFLETVKNGERN
jgi:hypothetical protein